MIGIIGAMEEEVSQIKESLEEFYIEERGGLSVAIGKLFGKEVVVVKCGVGKVNAAACTELIIDRYGADAIINTGIAGSLSSEIDIGDIVLSSDAVQYDMDAVNFGFSLGEVPFLGTLSFEADKKLLELAKEKNAIVNPDIHTFTGRVCSGDKFVSDKETKEWIYRNFSGLCCEMEGAAIAQIAWQNKVPFLIIRAISDKADNDANIDFPTFQKQAIKHSIRLTKALVADYVTIQHPRKIIEIKR